MPVEIVEWPGGEPRQIDLDVTPQVFASVRKGRMTVPLGEHARLGQVAGLPWGSIATVHSAGDQLYRIVGPAIWQTDKWSLPVFPTDAEGLAGLRDGGGEVEAKPGAGGGVGVKAATLPRPQSNHIHGKSR